ncbi:MAG: class I SAM-dependent methyltransferase [Acidobacteria bacterium]|nr:class I SAM-dependent methyltransferase [Acidobacteriota bacterium]
MAKQKQKIEEKEAAFLYDLVLVQQWRERFDELLDASIKLPEKGTFLEIGSGTGAYAIDLVVRGGNDVKVIGLENNEAMRVIAQGKAEMQKVSRVEFRAGSVADNDLPEARFALVVADASLLPTEAQAALWLEAARLADKGATVAVKLATRGSFDEFFSIYWEALYELDWLDATAALESLITSRVTASEAEAMAQAAKLKQISSETHRLSFSFADGKTFLNDPLMRNWFLDEWLALRPATDRQQLEDKLAEVIDRAREELDFELSIKATIVMARK